MRAKLIDGRTIAAKARKIIAEELAQQIRLGIRAPGLAVILVGDDPASHIYVDNKRQACKEVGIISFCHQLPETVSEPELVQLIGELNHDPLIDGILLQLPLPRQINVDSIVNAIDPNKDVDGFHPYNIGRLANRKPLLRPCTPVGVMTLLDSIQTQYKKKRAVVIGASNLVGRPMALELLLAGSTVTVCHRFTTDLQCHVSHADILISAVGKPDLIKGDWIKTGATVIDVGITRLADGAIKGDIEFDAAAEKAEWITPVPGGVGPMTIVSLLKNTLSIWRAALGLRDMAISDF